MLCNSGWLTCRPLSDQFFFHRSSLKIFSKNLLKILVFSPLILRWQDIVVGAPQYFDRSGDIGGAVYIYINRQGKWEGVKPIRLNGTTDSMFGLAVENVGDINQDGYPGE